MNMCVSVYALCVFQLCLADRSLMPGDVVRRLIEGKDSQRGYVVDLQGQCHLRVLGVDKYIYDVSTKDVMPLQVRVIGDLCIYCSLEYSDLGLQNFLPVQIQPVEHKVYPLKQEFFNNIIQVD